MNSHVIGILQTVSDVSKKIYLPLDWDPSWSKADGLKSRSYSAQPVHLSTTVTTTLAPEAEQLVTIKQETNVQDKALIFLPQKGELLGLPALGTESYNPCPIAQIKSVSLLVIPQLPSLTISL